MPSQFEPNLLAFKLNPTHGAKERIETGANEPLTHANKIKYLKKGHKK